MADYKRKMGIEEDRESSAYWREKEARRQNAPGKYDSIRPSGESDRISTRKVEGLKQAASGAAMAPVGVALEAAMGRSDTANKGPIGAGVAHLSGTGDRAVRAAKEAADYIGSGMSKYRNAKEDEADLDRELESQNKREARGMKKGGSVRSASSRADGIATKGKTRGTMIMCGGGKVKK